MTAGISGGRGDGTPWPPVGGELDVGDEEGQDLIQARLAIPVEEPAERAVVPDADVEERAAPKRARKS